MWGKRGPNRGRGWKREWGGISRRRDFKEKKAGFGRGGGQANLKGVKA